MTLSGVHFGHIVCSGICALNAGSIYIPYAVLCIPIRNEKYVPRVSVITPCENLALTNDLTPLWTELTFLNKYISIYLLS